MKILKIAIIIPVYNDWDALKDLIFQIDRILSKESVELHFILVDDASTNIRGFSDDYFTGLTSVYSVDIVHMNCNLGHQRAIAVGMVEASRRDEYEAIVIMDADGEDKPEDLVLLLGNYREKGNDGIIVASRGKRSEGMLFSTGYKIYKIIFYLLTGRTVNFGNFCLIPAELLNRLIYRDSLWNHLPATILRSKLPIFIIPTDRGKRIQGDTKMNFGDLVLHGFSAISVYIDKVFLRTLFLSMLLFIGAISGIGVVVIIRFFTDLAIPGWASDVAGSLLVIVILSLLLSIFVLFLVLANRSQISMLPALHSAQYIQNIQTVFKK